MNKRSFQAGLAALISVIIVLPVAMVVALSINSLVFLNKKTVDDVVRSMQSYYTSEAAIEDSLLRVIDPTLTHQASNTLALADSSASVTVDLNTNLYTVVADGDASNRRRKISTQLSTNTTEAEFFYGVQVGDGGLLMENNAEVQGNVYVNGNIIGNNNARVTGDAWSANANTIDNITITGDAHGHRLQDSSISHDAYYEEIDSTSVGGTQYPNSPDPPPQALPISDEQITTWKTEAAAGGTRSDLSLSGSQTALEGPVKIEGNLTLENSAVLTVTGTIWITGDVLIKNNSVIQLDSGYGGFSGVIVADGEVTLENSALICGSSGGVSGGTCNAANGSYVLLLTTHSGDPALHMKNNADLQGVLYTSAGVLLLENNATLKEATGFGMHIKNNAVVVYETGLANLNFSSGPSGGWDILNWQEVE